MKCYTYINEQEEEKVLIYAKERTKLVEDIESLVLMDDVELTGTCNEEIIKIDIKQVSCFISESVRRFLSRLHAHISHFTEQQDSSSKA